MARKLGTWPPGSPEWRAARQGRIGGCDVAAICGWSPWTSREQLLAQKLDGTHKPLTAAMDRGNRLEAPIIDWLLARHDLTLDETDSTATWVDELDDRLLYNPDGIAATADGELVLLEAKTVADRCEPRGWGRAGTDLVPTHYQAQVMWGMGLLGITRAHVGVLHGATNGRPDLGFATYTITYDSTLFTFIKYHVLGFLTELNQAKELAA